MLLNEVEMAAFFNIFVISIELYELSIAKN